MDAAVIAVLGTLGGTALGGTLTYVSQRLAFRRESGERRATARRTACVAWLAAAQTVYEATRTLTRENQATPPDPEARVRAFRAIPAVAAQSELETLRLSCDDDVLSAAAAMWSHIRKSSVARGEIVDLKAIREWQDRYWALRHEFIDAARREIGLRPVDWSTAGSQSYWKP